MKTLLLTLIFCILNLINPEIIGKYQIESELSFDTLELKEDGTFEYKSQGDSCWTWSEFSGLWELKGDSLILRRKYSFFEKATSFLEKTDIKNSDNVTFEVKDNSGNPISNFEIKYWCQNENEQIQKTDQNGFAEFNKCSKIEDDYDSAGIGIEFLNSGNKTTVTSSILKKSNRIYLTLNFKPKEINKTVEYSFLYKNGILTTIDFPYVTETSAYKKL
ncbi:hypothetical protein [uncultured Winogradskyella sp.]|uniref:hypothetical protein n=1 Tax=uncultured Winogradskyella sp. TaxID=395353 RepID=UPI002602CFA3|nr:hypothetical protein [uncultured Winogradskyella sp.]